MSARGLSILCVTKGEPHVWPFFTHYSEVAEKLGAELVLAGDGPEGRKACMEFGLQNPAAVEIQMHVVEVASRGYLESVLDDALGACEGDYVLRIDDDEKLSPSMVDWMLDKEYAECDHWKFPRLHLWGNVRRFISNPPLWPDHQTRLSVRAKSGGRRTVHAGSPYGGGALAPVALEHHKFLVKSLDARRAIALGYEKECQGYGLSWGPHGGMLPFNLPEEAYDELDVKHRGEGEAFAMEMAFAEWTENQRRMRGTA